MPVMKKKTQTNQKTKKPNQKTAAYCQQSELPTVDSETLCINYLISSTATQIYAKNHIHS